VPKLQADIMLGNAPMLALVRDRGYITLHRDEFSDIRIAIDAAQPARRRRRDASAAPGSPRYAETGNTLVTGALTGREAAARPAGTAAAYQVLGAGWDAARALLVPGRAQRRAKSGPRPGTRCRRPGPGFEQPRCPAGRPS
jgi:hypothetical protein